MMTQYPVVGRALFASNPARRCKAGTVIGLAEGRNIRGEPPSIALVPARPKCVVPGRDVIRLCLTCMGDAIGGMRLPLG